MTMDLIGKVLLVFFLVMGLIETCRLLLMWLLRPEKIADSILVIPMCGHVEDAEYLLRGAAESIRWEKHKRPRRFICVDGGMDRETKEICKHLQKELPFLEICRQEELGSLMFPERQEESSEEKLK